MYLFELFVYGALIFSGSVIATSILKTLEKIK